MGFFPDEYSITTSTITEPIIEDSTFSDPVKQIIFKSAFSGASFSAVYRSELLAGFGAKVERMFSFASDPERYSRGLLNHSIVSESAGFDETKAYLEQLHGEQVSMEYHHAAHLNLGHISHVYMLIEQGYDPVRNVLEAQSAIHKLPVYVEFLRFSIEDTAETPVDQDLLVPAWELLPQDKPTPFVNPYKNQSEWRFNQDGVTEIIIYCAYLGITPRPGTQTALDWEINGTPEPPREYLRSPELTQYYGYSFNGAYGSYRRLTEKILSIAMS